METKHELMNPCPEVLKNFKTHGMNPDQKRHFGNEYQDWCCRELMKHGIVIQSLITKEQALKAENLLGMEFKRDFFMREKGNLWIETHEKGHASNPKYVESGILASSRPWLFAIGNETILYIFATNRLKQIYEAFEFTVDIDHPGGPNTEGVKSPKWPGVIFKENRYGTSWCLLIPITVAEREAARVIQF